MSSWAALATCTTVPVQVDPPRHFTGDLFRPFCQVVVTKHYVSGSAGGAAGGSHSWSSSHSYSSGGSYSHSSGSHIVVHHHHIVH